MGVLSQILDWAKELPAWQSDAVRRIIVNGDLTELDRNEFLSMLKKNNGIQDPNIEIPCPIPLKASDLPTSEYSKNVVILKSLHDVKNVNALSSDQTLKFALLGVTIFYGDNASGKSGYCRILKKACRARGQAEEILPNVYATYNPNSIAEAIFEISVDGQDRPEKWINEQPAPDSLSNIAVFDPQAVRFLVDEHHNIIFEPYGLDIFTKLVNLCNSLKEELERSIGPIDSIPKILSDIEPTTVVGLLIKSLSYKIEHSEIERLANLTQDDLARLEQLRALFIQIDANRPEVQAAQYRRSKTRIEKVKENVVALHTGLSSEKLNTLKSLKMKSRETAEAARLASEEAFSNQPLQGVGAEPWRAMFEAARQYSTMIPYPNDSFPVTIKDARCVLCQQFLSDEAKQRLQIFENFIKEDIASKAEVAEQAFKQEWDSFINLTRNLESIDSETIDEIGEENTDYKQELLRYLGSVETLISKIQEFIETNKWDDLPSLSSVPTSHLQALIEHRETKANELESAMQSEEYQKIRAEFTELNARKILSDNKDLALNYIDRQLYQYRIQQCISDTDTRGISSRKTKIMNEVFSEALQNNLNEELESLGLNLKLEIIPETHKGITYHYLKLNNVVLSNIAVSRVLSEGEQRAAAIVSFLAEVTTSSNNCVLVFDDPVSSLDHLWQHKIAKRLVAEGKKRQIIIFTHDIVFLFSIVSECDNQLVPICKSTLRCSNTGMGTCDFDDVPWIAKDVHKRLGYIRSIFETAEKDYNASSTEAYRSKVKECYELLRECWERVVEELLFNKTVIRFDKAVKTQSLDGALVTNEYYVEIYHAMKKCSEFEHDAPAAINRPIPQPKEIKQDIDFLDSFTQKVNAGRKNIKKEREKLLSAPPPKLG